MGLFQFGGVVGGRGGVSRTLGLFGGVAVALLASTGCQNPVAQERDRMFIENRELRAQNETLSKQLQQKQDPPVVAPDAIKPAPAPTTVAVQPRLVTPTPAPTPAPAPVLPPDLGGDEVKVDAAAGTTTVTFIGNTLFRSGAADLEAPAKANLAKLVSALKGQYKGKTVEVQGHTDADPIKVSKWKSNQELSEARAKSVRDYLVSAGVDASRVSFKGFGESKPKTTDPKSKAQNRRVEVVVLTK